MVRFLISTAVYLVANAIGLLIAALSLSGFSIDAAAFVVAVAIFSLVQSVLKPLITRLALRSVPELMGGIALVTIFVGLFITELIMDGMTIGGLSNWLAATLLVWIASLVASIILPRYVFKKLLPAAGEKQG